VGFLTQSFSGRFFGSEFFNSHRRFHSQPVNENHGYIFSPEVPCNEVGETVVKRWLTRWASGSKIRQLTVSPGSHVEC